MHFVNRTLLLERWHDHKHNETRIGECRKKGWKF